MMDYLSVHENVNYRVVASTALSKEHWYGSDDRVDI